MLHSLELQDQARQKVLVQVDQSLLELALQQLLVVPLAALGPATQQSKQLIVLAEDLVLAKDAELLLEPLAGIGGILALLLLAVSDADAPHLL